MSVMGANTNPHPWFGRTPHSDTHTYLTHFLLNHYETSYMSSLNRIQPFFFMGNALSSENEKSRFVTPADQCRVGVLLCATKVARSRSSGIYLILSLLPVSTRLSGVSK
jgi:hypothetical protein